MAEQTVLVCDLAHEEPALATTAVELPFNGQVRRVDLCAEHDAQLQSLLAEFLSTADTGRRGSPRRGNRPAAKRAAKRANKRASGGRRRGGQQPTLPAGQEQIRAWAHEQGLEVSDRGRLPKAIVEQYRDAHEETPVE